MTNSGRNGEWFPTTPEFWSKVRLSIIGWQLWYADRSWFGSDSRDSLNAWRLAPEEGVQVLMVHHPAGKRLIVTGRDEYTLPSHQGSKLGLMIDESEFNDICKLAMTDTWRP